MRLISKTALAAVLLVGAGGIAATVPASASQDKDAKAAQTPPLKLSDAFRKVAAPAQAALDANDLATAATDVAASEEAAKTDQERYFAQQLRLSLVDKQQPIGAAADAAAMARRDAALAGPLEALINNPVTPQEQRGKFAYLRGKIAFDQKKYADALGYYAKAQAAGMQDQEMALEIAQA
jgi:hypothetical protein